MGFILASVALVLTVCDMVLVLAYAIRIRLWLDTQPHSTKPIVSAGGQGVPLGSVGSSVSMQPAFAQQQVAQQQAVTSTPALNVQLQQPAAVAQTAPLENPIVATGLGRVDVQHRLSAGQSTTPLKTLAFPSSSESSPQNTPGAGEALPNVVVMSHPLTAAQQQVYR